jgi:Fe-Mn family superoxide dismutase
MSTLATNPNFDDMHKRTFIKLTGMATASALLAPSLTFCTSAPEKIEGNATPEALSAEQFTQPALRYAYTDLEPHIDALTMEVHYSKHHAGYTKNLNAAVAANNSLGGKTIENILAEITNDAGDKAIRNNGGGYYNHNLYWEIMSPNGGGAPKGDIAQAIDKSFGSWDACKESLTKAAAGVFGSGWAWLCADQNKGLFICTTPNQDNPLMHKVVEHKGNPLIGLDVWEHAYYLKHQNKRADYLASFFDVLNWDAVNARFQTN